MPQAHRIPTADIPSHTHFNILSLHRVCRNDLPGTYPLDRRSGYMPFVKIGDTRPAHADEMEHLTLTATSLITRLHTPTDCFYSTASSLDLCSLTSCDDPAEADGWLTCFSVHACFCPYN